MNIEQQKKELLASQAKIEEELSALGRKVGDGDWMAIPDQGDGVTADSIDNADITEDYEEKLAVLKVLEHRYTQVAQALSAIEKGTYGSCSVCKKDISEERMHAQASAMTCIEHS
jgi:RNA polymerase-binding transcription factor DksA